MGPDLLQDGTDIEGGPGWKNPMPNIKYITVRNDLSIKELDSYR